MARTKDEIFEAMIALKDIDPILSIALTSLSKTSFYRSLFAVYADITGDFELTFDAFEATLDALLESKQIHTAEWWRSTSLEFQLGDPLTILANGNLGYSIIDEDKQIIKRAAIVGTGNGAITLKVAKLDGTGSPVPLVSFELSAYTSYINDIGPAGIVPTIVSVEGDEIEMVLEVLVDAALINVADGTLISDPTIKPVETAVFEYFGNFQNDDFGGTFFANRLTDTILDATGVINSIFVSLDKKAFNEGGFTDVLALPGKSFATFSGYVRIAMGFDLSANITYTAG